MADVFLICGIPGAGKDWFVENKIDNGKVVSFDDIRIKLFKKGNSPEKWRSLSTHELYGKAWAWCNSTKADLMKPLIEEVKELIKDGKKPCIANTMVNKKSRAKMLDDLKRAGITKIGCYYLMVDSKTALERNANRDSKKLADDIVLKFAKDQAVPTKDEGFEFVKVVFNK